MRFLKYALAFVLTGCSLSASGPESSTIRIELRSEADTKLLGKLGIPLTGPTVDGMSCLALAVTGPGIPTSPCIPVLTSALAAPTSGVLSMKVPSGPKRKIQVFGIKTQGACPFGQSLTQYILNSSQINWPDIYTLGDTTTDLFHDASVRIDQNYDPVTAEPISLAGCITTTVKAFVYTINNTADTINIFTYDPISHGMSSLPTFFDSHIVSPIAAVADPTGHYLFVVDNSSHDVVTYSINPVSGALTYVRFDGPFDPFVRIVAHPSSNILVTLDNAGALRSFNYTPGGPLTFINEIVVTGAGNPWLAIHSSGSTVYVSDPGSGVITDVQLSAGILTAIATHNFTGAGPIAVRPNGMGAYVASTVMPGNIRIFDTSTSGVITGSDQTVTNPFATAATIDASGQWLYIGDNTGQIDAFAVHTGDNLLTHLGASPFDSGSGLVTDLKGDPFGTQLFAIDNSGSTMHQMNMNANGTLDTPGGSGVGTGPTAVVVVHPL